MPDSTPAYHRFFAELKRRRVFRVMAVYGAVGFVLMQIVELLVPALLLPEWTYRFIALLLLLGFPITVILAWAFELTPEGVKRTEDASPGELTQIIEAPASSRWPAGLLALAGIAALLAGAWYAGRQSAADPGRPDSEPGAQTAQNGGEVDAGRGTSLAYVDPSEDPRPSIAVLPFVDMSQAGDQEYFSDGITEEILNVLSKIKDLQVTARTSAFAYKGTNRDLREVGRELGVEYLLEGSVRKADDQLRITAQLIDAQENSHLWSETYDRRLENVFEIQTEIAEAIAGELRLPLGLEEGESLVTPTGDLDAYDLYLAGRARMRERGLDGITQAMGLFEAAVARDSNWAPAWAGLAETRALYPYYANGNSESPDSVTWRQSLESAEDAARRSLELDPANASARVALANVYRDRWEWDSAEREYVRAIELDVDNVEAHHQYAEMLYNSGRPADGLVEASRALSLDRSPIRLNVFGWALWLNGRRDAAREVYEEAMRLDPEGRVHYIPNILAQIEMFEGRYEQALERFGPVLWDTASFRLSGEALASGDPAELLVHVDPGSGDSRFAVFQSVWVILGVPQQAIDVAMNALQSRPYGGLSFLWLPEPFDDPLYEHPRFKREILPLINLEGRVVRTLPPDAEIPGL